ncbi:hypothetical protein HYT58_00505 [Candidatus Woesearchaeota archaeon]|nr:hypothetical protein [Candidatus Woesearchaeota archaeon]
MKKLLVLIVGLFVAFSSLVSASHYDYGASRFDSGLSYGSNYLGGYRSYPRVDEGFQFNFNNDAYNAPYVLRRNNFNVGSSVSNNYLRDYLNENSVNNRNFGSAYLNDASSSRSSYGRDFANYNYNGNQNNLYKSRNCPEGSTFYKQVRIDPHGGGDLDVTEIVCDARIPVFKFNNQANTFANSGRSNTASSYDNSRSYGSGFENGANSFNSNRLVDNVARQENVNAYRNIAGRIGRGTSVFY